MNYLDVILLLPLAYGLIQGIRHGIVKEMAQFVAIVVAIYLARFFSPDFVPYVKELTGWDASVCASISYALVFIVVVLGVNLLAYIVTKLLSAVLLGGVNRFFGALFGLFKWALILSVVLNVVAIADDFLPVKENEYVRSSALYSHVESLLWKVLPGMNLDGFIDKVKNIQLPFSA